MWRSQEVPVEAVYATVCQIQGLNYHEKEKKQVMECLEQNSRFLVEAEFDLFVTQSFVHVMKVNNVNKDEHKINNIKY